MATIDKNIGLNLYSIFVISILFACSQEGVNSKRPTYDVPIEYADKHMPKDWWDNPRILSEGRLLYSGAVKSFVNCAECHGRDGKPVKSGAPDFTNTRRLKRFSDSYWFWRIAEGVPMTTMEAWNKKLSEDEIWKIIAYQKNFGLPGLIFNPSIDSWEEPKPIE